MSDAGRKDFSTKAKEELTPDSTKSTQDKVKETVTDTSDRVARGLQTDNSKSTTQEAFDKTQRSHDNHAHGGATGSVGEKVKNALGLGN
ncbi:heat shock 9/12 family protein [Aspergillus clavatus NRRL 1]|uniref:Chaperone/heat shock protein Hsp12, putative n=1 Tax=Aspergillus clavatus (strain ATCC 1007 / CBS 513.65 / DSM 816 / NCTC 3887 / NRRL 1 / QM 1276 / 107) TaxID=344612 RepID=A1CU87_ASPCL|nr:chaperone/heat shock protein Hsp12, putative [Aspergillus clavatus NRRL 1]EAW06874.1 chaperone/heat shock protein Hsp12, putative [Aspergillus clavatus NRRL 1]